MIGHTIEDSIPDTNELFDPKNNETGTIFALYYHSGGSSGYLQSQLAPQLLQFKFINISEGIMSYNLKY